VNFNQSAKATGSTACVCIFFNHNQHTLLKVVNLGDCRAVSCNTHNIGVALTKDHKPTSYDEYRRIVSSGGVITRETNDDPRINGLSVSRAFGDLDSKPHVSHIPDIYDYDTKNLKFVVIACDGVWDVMSNQEAVDFILSEIDLANNEYKNNFVNTKSRANIAYKLVQYAYEKGSHDNLTALVIFL
jgi:serine/threonine protein phosphatase PrpC